MINISLLEKDILLNPPVTLPETVLRAKVGISTINGTILL